MKIQEDIRLYPVHPCSSVANLNVAGTKNATRAAMTLEPEFEAARAAFRAFLDPISKDKKIVGLHDVDADGLAAGAV